MPNLNKQVVVTIPRMAYSNTRVSKMNARQMQDTLEVCGQSSVFLVVFLHKKQDLQMHWAKYIEEIELSVLLELTDALMARFGHFCLYAAKYDVSCLFFYVLKKN